MFKFNVDGKEYKIQFGYKVLAMSGLIEEIINSAEDNENAMHEIIPLVAKLTFWGLQKNHKEFRLDCYDDVSLEDFNIKSVEDDYRTKLKKVYDLLDEYIGSDEDTTVMDVYEMFTTELVNKGFLSQKSQAKLQNLQT